MVIILQFFGFFEISVNAETWSVAPRKVVISGSNGILVGKTTQLKANVIPKEATQDVTWESDDSSIASVDSKGIVKGKKKGFVLIVARSTVNFKIWECFLINVTDVPVAEIVIEGATERISTGRTVTLTTAVKPFGAANSVEWKSSNSKVATIDQDGTLSTKKPGTVKITATALDGSKTSKSITILVEKGQFNRFQICLVQS